MVGGGGGGREGIGGGSERMIFVHIFSLVSLLQKYLF